MPKIDSAGRAPAKGRRPMSIEPVTPLSGTPKPRASQPGGAPAKGNVQRVMEGITDKRSPLAKALGQAIMEHVAAHNYPTHWKTVVDLMLAGF